MIINIILLVIYYTLLKKLKNSSYLYDSLVNNRSSEKDYFLDYCDEPICFK